MDTKLIPMKQLKIDNNAHNILMEKAKKMMKKEGIESPSASEVIRWLWKKSGGNSV